MKTIRQLLDELGFSDAADHDENVRRALNELIVLRARVHRALVYMPGSGDDPACIIESMLTGASI
jgi:hypothetical protein